MRSRHMTTQFVATICIACTHALHTYTQRTHYIHDMHAYMHACAHECKQARTHTCMHASTHAHTEYAHTCVRIHAYITHKHALHYTCRALPVTHIHLRAYMHEHMAQRVHVHSNLHVNLGDHIPRPRYPSMSSPNPLFILSLYCSIPLPLDLPASPCACLRVSICASYQTCIPIYVSSLLVLMSLSPWMYTYKYTHTHTHIYIYIEYVERDPPFIATCCSLNIRVSLSFRISASLSRAISIYRSINPSIDLSI